ncbi:MAG: galactokinase [Candidatus Merdivicinus sp.]|jgi:galactokinase
MNAAALKQWISDGKVNEKFTVLYGKEQVEAQKVRYCEAVDAFVELYGDQDNLTLFSAPGRTEIAGNHTDHNHGRVVAASVNLDVIAVVSVNASSQIRIKSKGYRMDTVEISEMDVKPEEDNKAISLIRGVAARFQQKGYKIGGFDAYTTSNVLKGSGLSSSAAFEVLVGTILNYTYNEGKVSPVEIAKYAQYAENVYFGKPSGLMDQMASSVGSAITIDFADTENPVIEKMDFDLNDMGCALCIVDVGGNHADLTHEYAAIPTEMKQVASYFGKEVLRGISCRELLDNATAIREKFGDRAFLRAFHFINENERVGKIVDAIRTKDYASFKKGIIESGNSSFRYLQNVYANPAPQEQGMSVALAIAEMVLDGCGAWRVHGGGFGGTTQNFVPFEKVEEFRKEIEAVFGEGSCHILSIRPLGGTQVL